MFPDRLASSVRGKVPFHRRSDRDYLEPEVAVHNVALKVSVQIALTSLVCHGFGVEDT